MSIAEKIEPLAYKVANPVMKALLRSPLHGLVSKNIALLHFRGRKSGRDFVTPSATCARATPSGSCRRIVRAGG